MAQIYNGAFVVVTAASTIAATGAASARVVIPVDGSGNKPNFLRIAARNECYVAIGDSSVAAVNTVGATGSILVQPADAVTIQVPKGATHVAHIQGSAAGQVCYTPLDNS
jgi:hypothetical protein